MLKLKPKVYQISILYLGLIGIILSFTGVTNAQTVNARSVVSPDGPISKPANIYPIILGKPRRFFNH